MSLNIESIRAQTPGLKQGIHLLACGSALVPQTVHDAVINHLNLEMQLGGYEAHAQQAEQLDRVYDHVAALVGAKRNEIAIQENATLAWCQAFYALPLKRGDRILTCEAEYAANYVAFLQRAKRDGVIIDVIPSDKNGDLDLAALESKINPSVKLIAITWVPTNGGLVNPAESVGQIAQYHGIPYLLDACQAVGQITVDVTKIGCDFLSATGRKFLRGPRGVGFLYIEEKWIEQLEPVMIDHFAAPWVSTDEYRLRSDARRFETWENAYALRAGLSAAADYACQLGLESIQQRAWALADYFRGRLALIKGARCLDMGSQQCAIVSFSIDRLDPRQTVEQLKNTGIVIGASDAASTRLDAQKRNLPTVLRMAPHYYNTQEEIDQLIDELLRLI